MSRAGGLAARELDIAYPTLKRLLDARAEQLHYHRLDGLNPTVTGWGAGQAPKSSGCAAELGADHQRWYPTILQGHGVVHTAQGAGPSISNGRHHEIAPLGQPVHDLRVVRLWTPSLHSLSLVYNFVSS